MRRPIQIQLLVPMLSVVVLAILLASGAGGYYSAMRQRQSQEDSLKRVVDTLADGPHFPLTGEVLQQMSGLSGAEFVFLEHGPTGARANAAAERQTTKRGCGTWPAVRVWSWAAASISASGRR